MEVAICNHMEATWGHSDQWQAGHTWSHSESQNDVLQRESMMVVSRVWGRREGWRRVDKLRNRYLRERSFGVLTYNGITHGGVLMHGGCSTYLGENFEWAHHEEMLTGRYIYPDRMLHSICVGVCVCVCLKQYMGPHKRTIFTCQYFKIMLGF